MGYNTIAMTEAQIAPVSTVNLLRTVAEGQLTFESCLSCAARSAARAGRYWNAIRM